MQAVMETAFDILYLCTVCILGITMDIRQEETVCFSYLASWR